MPVGVWVLAVWPKSEKCVSSAGTACDWGWWISLKRFFTFSSIFWAHICIYMVFLFICKSFLYALELATSLWHGLWCIFPRTVCPWVGSFCPKVDEMPSALTLSVSMVTLVSLHVILIQSQNPLMALGTSYLSLTWCFALWWLLPHRRIWLFFVTGFTNNSFEGSGMFFFFSCYIWKGLPNSRISQFFLCYYLLVFPHCFCWFVSFFPMLLWLFLSISCINLKYTGVLSCLFPLHTGTFPACSLFFFKVTKFLFLQLTNEIKWLLYYVLY